MSIQSEINRISNNVSDALAATAEMGASIPEAANSDDLGTLIRSIPKENGTPIVDAISDDGVTYTATVPNVTELYAGLKLIIVPNCLSTHTKPTLNVNGLGAKSLFSKVSSKTGGYAQFANENFLSKGIPVEIMYSGNHWKVYLTRPVASTMHGEVSVANGGTGRATLTSGYYLVGNGTNAVTLRSKSQVLSDIGAVSVSDYNALLARVEELESTVNDICNNLGIA